MELQRICPLTVILGVSKEEVDDLLSAREGAPRTVQVWLQDALLAPPEEDYYMEPSGAERAHLHQLLSAAAAASNETRRESDTLVFLVLHVSFRAVQDCGISFFSHVLRFV